MLKVKVAVILKGEGGGEAALETNMKRASGVLVILFLNLNTSKIDVFICKK